MAADLRSTIIDTIMAMNTQSETEAEPHSIPPANATSSMDLLVQYLTKTITNLKNQLQ